MIDLEADVRMRIFVCGQRMRRNLESRAHAVGLTLTELAALHALLHAGEKGLSLAELARRLGTSRATSSQIAVRLELASFVEIVPDRSSPRFKWLHLTPEGLAAYRFANTSDFTPALTREETLALYPLLDRAELPTRAAPPRERAYASPGRPTRRASVPVLSPPEPVQPPNGPLETEACSLLNKPSQTEACSVAKQTFAERTMFTR